MLRQQPIGVCTCALLCALGADATSAQTPQTPEPNATDDSALTVNLIGRVFDRLREVAKRIPVYRGSEAYDDYTNFKARLARDSGLSWVIDVSYLQQWGLHGAGSPAGQALATPSFSWDLFDHQDFGTGSLQLIYNVARYTTAQDALGIQDRLGLITPINDYSHRQNIFPQLTYTHTFPGKRWLAGAGQYPIYNFDDNDYLNNQQLNFNNYILSQNGSATYPLAGLGAYVQFTAASSLQFAAGGQNASNVQAPTLAPQSRGEGLAWFGYGQWTPEFDGMGAAQYSLLFYQAPDVPLQPRTRGWSLNAVQNLNDTWAVFGRANRAYQFVTPIRASYALGVAMNNPFGRSATDQIAFAVGYGDAAPPPTNPSGARNEKVLEGYLNWTFAKGLLITPDVQYIVDPALDPARRSVWILSLRTTFLF